MSPQPSLAPAPPQRFKVRAGIQDNQPFIELVDTLAMTEITMPLTVALEMAAGMNHAAVALMTQAQAAARKAQRGIVAVDGKLL